MREGPFPLAVHLGLAQTPWPALITENAASGPLAVQGEYNNQMQKLIEGIKLYQGHGYKRTLSELPAVWEKGGCTIRLCEAHNGKNSATPILLVPSLINSERIFDLIEQRSFVRWLSAQGCDVYMIEWGDLGVYEDADDLGQLIETYLVGGIEHVCETVGRPINVLGYCMGGTMLVGAAQVARDKISSLVFLATPWDFEKGDQKLRQMIQMWLPAARTVMAQNNMLPHAGIQSLFAGLDASQAREKFVRFAKMDMAAQSALIFVAVEDWVNEGYDLPAEIARECMEDWFLNNKTGQANWFVAGQPVIPEELDVRSLVVASPTDKLVSYECGLSLQEGLPACDHVAPACGHVGMMAGGAAEKEVWLPILTWIKEGN